MKATQRDVKIETTHPTGAAKMLMIKPADGRERALSLTFGRVSDII